MKRLALFLALLLALSLPVLAEEGIVWQEGEAFFPEGEGWRYRYSYRYPLLEGDSFAAQAINEYFTLALKEQMELVVPMYANDPIMAGGDRQQIEDSYSLTLNDDRLFSILLSRSQSMDEGTMLSLSSVVFTVAGEYVGESLTLRGVCGVGESSAQIAAAVLQDVWRQVKARIDSGEAGWKPGLDFGRFEESFYPELQFYAEADDVVTFYLQPGEYREDSKLITFSYSYADLERLIEPR